MRVCKAPRDTAGGGVQVKEKQTVSLRLSFQDWRIQMPRWQILICALVGSPITLSPLSASATAQTRSIGVDGSR